MLRTPLLLLVVCLALAACKPNEQSQEGTVQNKKSDSPAALRITSNAFDNRGMIPSKYTCDGLNFSPPLTWTGVPKSAKSLALICDDPDAPAKTWVHWVVYNMHAFTDHLAEHVPPDSILTDGTRQGLNDFVKTGYSGPCPPGGTHRYFFKLYALDTKLDLGGRVTKADLLQAMKGHIVAKGELMGRYRRR